MKNLRNFAIAILSLCCLMFMACGNASPSGGGGNGTDPGDNNGVSVNLKVLGYSDTPTISCWGTGLNFQGQPNQAGTIILNVPYAPDTIQCSPQNVDGSWVMSPAGVCSGYQFFANEVEITTWTGQVNSANYQFKVGADGTVTITGQDINWLDCTDGDPPSDISCDLEVIYLGSYPNPRLYLDGGGVIWGETFAAWTDAVDDNGDLLTDINGDTISQANGDPGLMLTVTDVYPDDFLVNMDMTGSRQTWLVYLTILPGENLYINGVLLDQLLPNGAGSNNLAFTVNDACEVVLLEDTEEVDVIIDLP